jgi:hypothetical protein
MGDRLALMHDVARTKWNTKRSVGDPRREQVLLREMEEKGQEYGLDRSPREAPDRHAIAGTSCSTSPAGAWIWFSMGVEPPAKTATAGQTIEKMRRGWHRLLEQQERPGPDQIVQRRDGNRASAHGEHLPPVRW